MSTVFFNGDNGKLSSVRSTMKIGKSKMILTQYPGRGLGGVTFNGRHMTSRLNQKGQSIAFGVNNGKRMTYIGKDGKTGSRISAF